MNINWTNLSAGMITGAIVTEDPRVLILHRLRDGDGREFELLSREPGASQWLSIDFFRTIPDALSRGAALLAELAPEDVAS